MTELIRSRSTPVLTGESILGDKLLDTPSLTTLRGTPSLTTLRGTPSLTTLRGTPSGKNRTSLGLKSVWRSITEGNSRRLSKLLGRKAAFRQEELTGPMLEAVRLGQEKCVASLLSSGADPNCVDDEGRTPLYLLMEKGGANPAILKELLKAGSSPNKTTWALQQTALHMAAKKGYQVCVKSLVGAGGRLDKKDSAGNTALMFAAREGHANVVRALIDLGARPNERNLTNETPLHFAARGGHLDATNELLMMGGSPNVRDSRGQTPLLLSCKHGHCDVTQLLLDYHCDVNAQDTQTGKTSVHWAIQNGHAYIVTELLDAGAEPNIRDKNWYTPFMLALSHSRRDIMELLLHAGCKVDVTDSEFNTALHLAARDGQTDLITLLIDAGIHVDIKGAGGLTPLMLASFGGYVSIVGLLLKFGASVDMMDRNRATALTYAILSEAPDTSVNDIIKILIRMNCNLNRCTNLIKVTETIGIEIGQGTKLENRLYSPLEVAFLKGRAAVFMVLIHSGCCLDDFHCDKVHSVQEFRSLGPDLKNRWYLLRCLQKERLKVKSLKQLCRRPVLDSLRTFPGDGIQVKIAHLPLSDQLKSFLNFSDLEEVEMMYQVTLRDKRRSGPARLEGIVEESRNNNMDKRRHTLSPTSAGSFRYTSSTPGSGEPSRRKSMPHSPLAKTDPSRRLSMIDSSHRNSLRISDDPLNRSSLVRSSSLRASSESPETRKGSTRSRIKSDSSAPSSLKRSLSVRLNTPSPSPISQNLARTSSMRLYSPSPVSSETLPRSRVKSPPSPASQSFIRTNSSRSASSPRTSNSVSRSDGGRSLTNQESSNSASGSSQVKLRSSGTKKSDNIHKRKSLPPGYYSLRPTKSASPDSKSINTNKATTTSSGTAKPMIRSILRHSKTYDDLTPEVQNGNVVEKNNNVLLPGTDDKGFVTNGETGELTPCISPISPKSPGVSPTSPKKEVTFSLPSSKSEHIDVNGVKHVQVEGV